MNPYDKNDGRNAGGYQPDDRTRAYSQVPQDYETSYGYRDQNYAASDYRQNHTYRHDQNYQGDGYRQPNRRPRTRIGPRVNTTMFVGGVIATAVVTALGAWLVAWIIRLISERITETGKFGVWNPVAQDEYWFAVVGALCAILGGALWYALRVATPAPDQFYTWIVGLLIVAAVLVPLLLSREISAGIGTAVMHVVIGLPVMLLISAMGSKSIE